jgi:hypothetical protein
MAMVYCVHVLYASPLWIFLLLGICQLPGCLHVGCGCGWSRGCGLCPN